MTSKPDPTETDGVEEAAEPFADGMDAYIDRNREALAAMVVEARTSLDRGDSDERSIDEVIAEGRRRLRSLS